MVIHLRACSLPTHVLHQENDGRCGGRHRVLRNVAINATDPRAAAVRAAQAIAHPSNDDQWLLKGPGVES